MPARSGGPGGAMGTITRQRGVTTAAPGREAGTYAPHWLSWSVWAV